MGRWALLLMCALATGCDGERPRDCYEYCEADDECGKDMVCEAVVQTGGEAVCLPSSCRSCFRIGAICEIRSDHLGPPGERRDYCKFTGCN